MKRMLLLAASLVLFATTALAGGHGSDDHTGSTSGGSSTRSSAASECNAIDSWLQSCQNATCTKGVLTAKCDIGTLTGPSLDVTTCPKNKAGQYEVSNCNGNLVCGTAACSCANSSPSCPSSPPAA